jgi:hypothetical protein
VSDIIEVKMPEAAPVEHETTDENQDSEVSTLETVTEAVRDIGSLALKAVPLLF